MSKVLDVLPVGLWIADEEGKLLQGNPAGVAIWGAEPGDDQRDQKGHGVFRARRLPSREEIVPENRALARTVSKGETIVDELLEIDALDGKKKIILNHTAPVLDGQGKVEAAIVVNQDITIRYQAEKALNDALSRLRFYVENSPLAVIEWDQDRQIKSWSAQAEAMFGWVEQEVVGKSWADFLVHPEDEQKVAAQLDRLDDTTDDYKVIENRNLCKNGNVLHCHWFNSFLRDESGSIVSILSQVENVTDLKTTVDELVTAKEQAEAANKAKSEFLANMSHELRTPFNGIMGMLQLLQTTSLDAEQKQFIDMSIRSADRFTRLLTDILDISRIEAGKLEICPEPFSLRKLHDSVADLFTVEARNKGISLNCLMDPLLPPRLIGDAARIRQVLFNLVGNALKFTEKGSVTVEMVPLSRQKTGECRILFVVSDTGIGIPEEKLGELFKPFVQVDGSYTRKYQGAGLGLSIVKRLVELMGGSINVDSTFGVGTAVCFALPFKLPPEQCSSAVQKTEQFSTAKQSLRILLAEDEPSNALPTMKLLENAGHVVSLAEDGQQARDLLAAQNFDVILMDVQMPVMNGVEATKAIRKSTTLGEKMNIPIIALTAYAMAKDREKFLEAGMNDYLAKPVKIEDLAQVLERTVGNTDTL